MEHNSQEPTHNNLRVTSSADARAVLYLVDSGHLEPVKRRPDDSEKAGIGHGYVFVWLDGAKGETGLEVSLLTVWHSLPNEIATRHSAGQTVVSGVDLGVET
jgi:hypothetical protein